MMSAPSIVFDPAFVWYSFIGCAGLFAAVAFGLAVHRFFQEQVPVIVDLTGDAQTIARSILRAARGAKQPLRATNEAGAPITSGFSLLWKRSPSTRRLLKFEAALLAVLSLANVIANDKPLIMVKAGLPVFPVFRTYQETRFGGDFETPADYRDRLLRTY
jgi:hypothetical protein